MNNRTTELARHTRPYLAIGTISAGELRHALAGMLDDDDWMAACQDADTLTTVLRGIDEDSALANAPPPPGLISMISAHADFCRFRRELAATLNRPDGDALHITPEEWLRHRVRSYAPAAGTRTSFARFRMQEDRFHIG